MLRGAVWCLVGLFAASLDLYPLDISNFPCTPPYRVVTTNDVPRHCHRSPRKQNKLPDILFQPLCALHCLSWSQLWARHDHRASCCLVTMEQVWRCLDGMCLEAHWWHPVILLLDVLPGVIQPWHSSLEKEEKSQWDTSEPKFVGNTPHPRREGRCENREGCPAPAHEVTEKGYVIPARSGQWAARCMRVNFF